jgi:glutamyl-tRNA synthetase
MAKGVSANDEKINAVVSEIKERCEFVSDIWEQSFYFFEAPIEYDSKTVKKRWKEDTPEKLIEIAAFLETINEWNAVAIKEKFSAFMDGKGWGFGMIMNPLRLSLVGGNMGPDLFVICEILGKKESVQRINSAIKNIQK